MTNQILLSVDKRHLSVAPGANVTLAVAVQNLTTLLDQVAVRADGIDRSWVQVIPPYLPVFAQGEATARVIIQPPRDAARVVAGRYPLKIRGTSQEFPGQETEAESELEIQFVGDYRFWLGGEKREGKEAVYPVNVQNDGNASLRLQFKGSDRGDALWYRFDPFQLTVPPGGTASTVLTLKPKESSPGERTIVFDLTAHGEYATKDGTPVAAPPHHVSGEFVQGAPARLNIGIQPLQVQARERGVFVVRVGNPGAAPATVQLAARDDDSLEFDFQPARATLAPQSETSVTLTVHGKGTTVDGTHQHVFQVLATPVDDETPGVSAEASFVQLGPAPAPARARSFPWALALGVLAFACLAMFLLVIAIGPILMR